MRETWFTLKFLHPIHHSPHPHLHIVFHSTARLLCHHSSYLHADNAFDFNSHQFRSAARSVTRSASISHYRNIITLVTLFSGIFIPFSPFFANSKPRNDSFHIARSGRRFNIKWNRIIARPRRRRRRGDLERSIPDSLWGSSERPGNV